MNHAATRQPVRAIRAATLTFVLGDQKVIVPAPTIDQAIACLALDPDPAAEPETPRERLRRIVAQTRALLPLEQHALVGALTAGQCIQFIQALYAVANGIDPNDLLTMQRALAEAGDAQDALMIIGELEDLTVKLAAELKRLPAEVGATPLADALSLSTQLAASRRRDMTFDASLHGAKIIN